MRVSATPNSSESPGVKSGVRMVRANLAEKPLRGSNGRGRSLTAAQWELVNVCEYMALQCGFSRSAGHIFGLIYSSPTPISFVEMTRLSKLSKGSISQGLRFLREVRVVKAVSVPGTRRIGYAASSDLRTVLTGIIRARLRAPLEDGAERLRAFKEALHKAGEPGRDFLFQRLSVMQVLHRKVLRVLPLIERTIEGGRT